MRRATTPNQDSAPAAAGIQELQRAFMRANPIKKPRVLLVFPPRWNALAPFLAIPQLTAYLRPNGISVKGSDLNAQLMRWMVSTEGTEELGQAIRIIISVTRNSPYPGLSDFRVWARLWIDDLPSDHRFVRKYLQSRSSPTARDIHAAEVLIRRAWDLTEMAEAAQRRYPEVPLPHRAFLERNLKALLAWKPDIVGFSAATQKQLLASREFARTLKGFGCRAPFVAGGSAVSSAFGAHFLESSLPREIDCCVVGPGEDALVRLVSMWSRGIPWPRRLQGREIPSAGAYLPDFNSLDMGAYLRMRYSFPYPFSHGCRWRKCRFCGLYCTQAYRAPDPGKVMRQLRNLQKRFGCSSFFNSGAELAADDAARIASALESKSRPVRWQSMARADRGWTEPLCRRLKGKNFEYVMFGIESLSNPVLKMMGKGISAVEQIDALAAACKSGLKPAVSLIFDFPGEKISDLETTLQSLAPFLNGISSISLLRFHLDRTSVLAGNGSKYGLKTTERMLRSIERDDIFQIRYQDSRRESRHLWRAWRLFDRWIYSINRERSILFSRTPLGVDVVFDADYVFEGCHPSRERLEGHFKLDAVLNRRYRLNRCLLRSIGGNKEAAGYYHKYLFEGIDAGTVQARITGDLDAGCTVAEAFGRAGVSPGKDLSAFNSSIQMINGLDMLRVIVVR